MGAAKRTNSINGYGEKLSVRIITVDKPRRRVECATSDGAMIWAAIWETPIVFRWPKVGETWTVRRDTNIWRLDQIVQTEPTELQSAATPITLENLPESDSRVMGDTVWIRNLHILGELKGPTIGGGTIWYTGSEAPSEELGEEGDFYFDTTTDDIYYKNPEWEIIANIKGSKGEKGATGSTGATGPQGEKGEKGDTGSKGEKGDKGDTGAKGETGEKGATGEKGEQGTPGSPDYKDSVRVCTPANVTIATALNAGDAVDGITLAGGDRVLVANQSTASQNGIYVAGSSPARATDADGAGELSGGTIVSVEQGTIYGLRTMKITTAGTITPGTTAHNWAPIVPKDHGIVESLPTSAAIKGDICHYKAAAGVYWDLLYTGEETYPWAKIGGSPLFAQYTETYLTTSSSTPQTTNAPSVTVPLAGQYNAEWGSPQAYSENASGRAKLGLFVNGVSAGSGLAAGGNGQGAGEVGSLYGAAPITAGSSQAVQVRYYREEGSGAANFNAAWIRVTPVRVG